MDSPEESLVPIRDMSPSQFSRISALLDESMEFLPSQRETWLAELECRDPQSAALLRKIFAAHNVAESDAFMETRDLLARHLSSLLPDEQALIGKRLGPYRVLSLLGHGGMGSVWLAERADGLFTRQVALKLLHPMLTGRVATERFIREREILASLSHANIARLFDAGFAEDGQPYLALQYVAGTPVTSYSDRGALTVRERLDLFLQVLSAVQYAHTNLVIHRDLKPSNILVTEEGQVQLLDFGIAKLLTAGEAKESELTQLGGRALTPEYAAPEQIAGGPITTATDVYSLGVMLYEFLTGERPYQLNRASRGALEEAIVSAEPMRPSQIVGDLKCAARRNTTVRLLRNALRGDLDTIVLKALKKSPNERYATVDALSRDIENFMRGRPVLAQPDSLWYRSRKILLRNRGLVAAATAIALTLTVGSTVAIWQARKASTEAHTAQVVQDFLRDIFRANSIDQADPERGRQTTAAQLLDIGARKIDTALAGAPEAKLRVVETLAQMYEELELTERAAALYRKRVELARALYGADSSAVATALVRLSVVLRASPADDERRRAQHEAVRILDFNRDFSSKTRARLALELGQNEVDKDPPRALLLTDQAVTIYRAYPPDRDSVSALIQQGIFRQILGRRADAEAAYLQALDVLNAIRPPTNHDRSQLYTYLAQTQRALQKFAAAESNHREAWRVAQIVGGSDHQLTLIAQLDLGWFLVTTGRAKEGLPIIRAATERIAATRGDDPQTIPYAFQRYGRALLAFGEPEGASDALAKAIVSLRRHRPGTGHLATALDFQARALVEVGQYGEAEALLDEAARIHREIKDDPPYVNENIIGRIDLRIATGMPREASKELDNFAVQAASPGMLSESASEQALLRAEVDLALGSLQEAAQSAGRVIGYVEQSSSREYFAAFEARALTLKGKALLKAGRDDVEALTWLARGSEKTAALTDSARSPELAMADVALAMCLAHLGEWSRAKALALSAQTIVDAHSRIGQQFKIPLQQFWRQERPAHKRQLTLRNTSTRSNA